MPPVAEVSRFLAVLAIVAGTGALLVLALALPHHPAVEDVDRIANELAASAACSG